MMLRLIKTEGDHEKALSRVEVLMGAKPDTPEMDELELLTALLEMYEDRHYPISPDEKIGWYGLKEAAALDFVREDR